MHTSLEKAGHSLEICEEHTWVRMERIDEVHYTNFKTKQFREIETSIEGIRIAQQCKDCGMVRVCYYDAVKTGEKIYDSRYSTIRGEEE